MKETKQYLPLNQEQSNLQSTLSTETSNDLLNNITWDKIRVTLEEDKVFLDTELNLIKFSEIVQIPKYKITKEITAQGVSNFSTLINKLRVEEFKQTFQPHFSIEHHAYDCGFKSKTTFNRVFKKIEGITPTQYIQSQLGE